jgi:hypothetical protein
MPYTDAEKRRAAGREAQLRYRRRHPEREAAYRRTAAHADARRRYRAKNIERVRAADRAAHRRQRERAGLSAGARAALMALERSLARAREPALIKRLSDACAGLRRLYGLQEAPFEETGDLRKRKCSQ